MRRPLTAVTWSKVSQPRVPGGRVGTRDADDRRGKARVDADPADVLDDVELAHFSISSVGVTVTSRDLPSRSTPSVTGLPAPCAR